MQWSKPSRIFCIQKIFPFENDAFTSLFKRIKVRFTMRWLTRSNKRSWLLDSLIIRWISKRKSCAINRPRKLSWTIPAYSIGKKGELIDSQSTWSVHWLFSDEHNQHWRVRWLFSDHFRQFEKGDVKLERKKANLPPFWSDELILKVSTRSQFYSAWKTAIAGSEWNSFCEPEISAF